MAKTESIRINDYVTERRRTTSSGTKSHYTVSIQSQPLQVTLDELAVGAGIAVALKDVLSSQIQGINETASSETLLKRKYAANAFAKGSRWATKRYAGGRTGPTPPGQSDRLFNDSGRLAKNLTVRANAREQGFTINVPNNRFDPSTFADQGQFLRMLDRLRELVPGLRDPASLLQDPKVTRAIRETTDKVLITKADRAAQLRSDLTKSALDLAREAFDIAEDIASESE